MKEISWVIPAPAQRLAEIAARWDHASHGEDNLCGETACEDVAYLLAMIGFDGAPPRQPGITPEPWKNLRELVAREGYALVIDDNAADHPDALGVPQRDELCAQVCKGNVIRMRSGLHEPEAWYPVSHEIAEDRTDFRGHTQRLWREQIYILTRWCARLAAALEAKS